MAERAHFGVAVARVQPARLDQVAAHVQPQGGYLVVAGAGFQVVEQPRAEPAPPGGGGHHEDAGDLADLPGQQAQPGAAEHGVVLARYQQQAAGRGQVVARLRPHGRRDLLAGGRAAVVPAGEFGEVGPQDPARGGGRRRHDRDDRPCADGPCAGIHSQGAVATTTTRSCRPASGSRCLASSCRSASRPSSPGLVKVGGGRRWRAGWRRCAGFGWHRFTSGEQTVRPPQPVIRLRARANEL